MKHTTADRLLVIEVKKREKAGLIARLFVPFSSHLHLDDLVVMSNSKLLAAGLSEINPGKIYGPNREDKPFLTTTVFVETSYDPGEFLSGVFEADNAYSIFQSGITDQTFKKIVECINIIDPKLLLHVESAISARRIPTENNPASI